MRLLASVSLIAYIASTFVCAKESVTFGRIIRGHDARIGQFPYVVRLSMRFEKPNALCAGALIGSTWVLTAAHCVANSQSVNVYLGSIFKDRYKVAYHVAISDITIHPQFNESDSDIALIKIPPTKMCQGIAIVRLPKIRRIRVIHSYPKYEKDYAKICGWGLTSRRGRPSTMLQWGQVQILSRGDCRHITKDELCTAISSNLATPYLGDSGGPLVLETTGELVGIASYGKGRNRHNAHLTQAIYTRVTSYLNWIKSVSGISYR